MKRYDLPSMEQIKAYKAGSLSLADTAFVEAQIKSNPFVKEVVETFSSDNAAAIQSISKRVNARVQERVLGAKGFWSTYGVWIGLSSIALLIGLAWLFQGDKNQTEQQVAIHTTKTNEGGNKQDNHSDLSASSVSLEDKNQHVDNIATAVDTERKTKEKKNSTTETKREENVNASLVDTSSEAFRTSLKQGKLKHESSQSKKMNIVKSDVDAKTEENIKKQSKDESNVIKEKIVQDKKAVLPLNLTQDDTEQTKSTKTTLSVKAVTLIAKENPRDQVVRKKVGKGNNILGRDNVKQQKSTSYSLDDLPSFPGGDQALFNYFKGKLHPLTIDMEEINFDKSVMLILEVNARGKLTNHEIYGSLHPKHQAALETAIENLPKFNAGNGEKVVYSIGISF